jgi:hypothetical protein
MTEYELIDAANSFNAQGATYFMNFVTGLFAYLLCAYLVGDKLTSIQFWLVNALYTAFTFLAAAAAYAGYNRQFLLLNMLDERFPQEAVLGVGVPQPGLAMVVSVVMFFGYIAGILFMMDKRRVTT